MPLHEGPTAEEQRDERAFRVVSLCCDGDAPDWRGAGQAVPPGGDILIRLQGHRDGRCGWSADTSIHVAVDGLELKVRPLLGMIAGDERWVRDPQLASVVLASLPKSVPEGGHALTVTYSDCLWSASVQVGAAPSDWPGVPVMATGWDWAHVKGAAAVWYAGKLFDVSIGPWVRMPPHLGYGWPTVVCTLDVSGRSHGAWTVVDSWYRPMSPYMRLIGSRFERADDAECDALR